MVGTPLPGSMPRRRRYRRWSAEEKRSICRETRAPGVSVAQVARRHALNANLIFKWLKDGRFGRADGVEAPPVFLPVETQAVRCRRLGRCRLLTAPMGGSRSSWRR